METAVKKKGSIFATIFFSLVLLTGALSLSSCARDDYTGQGAAVGGGLGALAGALIGGDNRWRGAVIGGLIGAAIGGSLAEISSRAAREAAAEGRPVAYESEDGFRRVEASPVGYDAQTKCHKVREREWQDGQLVKDGITEVCESDKTEPVY